MKMRSIEVFAEKRGKTLTKFLDKLEKRADGRFVHHPEYDPVDGRWISAFVSYIIATVYIMMYIPVLWPVFVYSYIVGALMAFFSLRSQRRRDRMERSSDVLQISTGDESKAKSYRA